MDKKHKTLEDFEDLTKQVNEIMITKKEEGAKYFLRPKIEEAQKMVRSLHFNLMEQGFKFEITSDIFGATSQIMFDCRNFLLKLNDYYYNYLEEKDDK